MNIRTANNLSWSVIVLIFAVFHADFCRGQQWGGSENILGGIYRNGYINVEGLYMTRYGSSFAGDSNPFTLSSAVEVGEDHDLTIYGSGNQTLHLRLFDGDFKLGSYGVPNTVLYNDGRAYFTGKVGIGISDPADQLEIVNGNRKVGFNTALSGISTGGLLSLSRPGDGHKIVYIGGASDDDHVVFGSGGSTEMRFVSGGGTSAGFGFYVNMPVETAFGVRSGLPLPIVKIDSDGDVGIGTSQPDQKLTVKGTIHAEEVKVDLAVPGPDYVFEKDYALLTLSELQEYINKNKHLPQVPSAKEMQENGLNLKEMNLILLKKVEELTLYAIDQKKISEGQASTTAVLINRINKLENRRDMLEFCCALLITIVLTMVGTAKWKSSKVETKDVLQREQC